MFYFAIALIAVIIAGGFWVNHNTLAEMEKHELLNDFCEALEGPFNDVVDLLNEIAFHKEFDDWGIYLDNKLIRTSIPADSDMYLYYETIGKRIFRC